MRRWSCEQVLTWGPRARRAHGAGASRGVPIAGAAVETMAPKIGCVPQTLLGWVQRHEVDTAVRDGVTTAEAQRGKALEREVKGLRRANEILKLASGFFAQAELDRRLKSRGTSSAYFRGRADLQGLAGCLSTPYGASAGAGLALCPASGSNGMRCWWRVAPSDARCGDNNALGDPQSASIKPS